MAVLWKIMAVTTAASVVGCSLPHGFTNAGNSGSSLGHSRAVPIGTASPGLGDVIVGGGERIRLSLFDTKRSHYICRNAMPLRCERRSFEFNCTCPKALRR